MLRVLTATVLALALATSISAPANAQVAAAATVEECTIDFDTSEQNEAYLVERGLAFGGFATLCPMLRDANVGVASDTAVGTVLDRKYALVVLRLYDLDTGIRSGTHVTSTNLGDNSIDVETGAQVVSVINSALQAVAEDPRAMISSVTDEVQRLRQFAASPVPPPAPSASPCKVDYLASPELIQRIAEWEGVVLADEALCARISAAGAGIILTEDVGVINDRTYGWIKIGLFDSASEMISPFHAITISVMRSVEESARNDTLRDALRGVVENLHDNQDQFFASLTGEVADMRRILAPR